MEREELKIRSKAAQIDEAVELANELQETALKNNVIFPYPTAGGWTRYFYRAEDTEEAFTAATAYMLLFELPGYNGATGNTTSAVGFTGRLYTSGSQPHMKSEIFLSVFVSPGHEPLMFIGEKSLSFNSASIRYTLETVKIGLRYYMALRPSSNTDRRVMFDGWLITGTEMLAKIHDSAADPVEVIKTVPFRTMRAPAYSLYGNAGGASAVPEYIPRQDVTDMLAIRKENLIDNWDMRNPVNQRGLREYPSTANIYTIDRWSNMSVARTVLSVREDCVRITVVNGSTRYGSKYVVEFPELLRGKTVTFSAIIRVGDGSLGFNFLRAVDDDVRTYTAKNADEDWELYSVTFALPDDMDRLYLAITIQTGAVLNSYIEVQAVKLEIGHTSTLLYDAPANYGQELNYAQRYQRVYSTDDIDTQGQTAPPMRVTPAITPLTEGANEGKYLYDANL